MEVLSVNPGLRESGGWIHGLDRRSACSRSRRHVRLRLCHCQGGYSRRCESHRRLALGRGLLPQRLEGGRVAALSRVAHRLVLRLELLVQRLHLGREFRADVLEVGVEAGGGELLGLPGDNRGRRGRDGNPQDRRPSENSRRAFGNYAGGGIGRCEITPLAVSSRARSSDHESQREV